jgi:predicted peroxiredoxin
VAGTEKLVIIVTHGPNEAELATIPFVMAVAALASDVAVAMAFQGEGIELMRKGAIDTVQAPEFAPLSKLFADARGLGAAILACSPCMKSRAMTAGDLVEGAEVVAAGRLIAEVTSATNTLTY